MITEEQYKVAVKQKDEADKIIRQYFQEKHEAFKQRLTNGRPFTDEELYYSAYTFCPCGHGLAYPKECLNPKHYWDCSAILKGIADLNAEHTDQLPFAFYDIKGESEYRGTTRGKFMPKKSEEN